MTIRELIEELIKHDMDYQVYLVNGNDLMRSIEITDVRVKEYYNHTHPKFYEVKYPLLDNALPNAVLLRWT